MTLYPQYFTNSPNELSDLPFRLAIHTLPSGFAAHRHDFLEFSYVLEGTGWETIGGFRYRKEPGSFTFVLPYQVHEIHTDPGSCLRLYNGQFSMSLLFETGYDAGLRGLMIGEDPPLASHVQLDGERERVFRRLLDELFAEYKGDARWRIPLVRAKLTELLVRFDRVRRELTPMPLQRPKEEPRGKGTGEKALWSIIQYIHLHYQDELTLSGIASTFHLSVSHLSELFKKHSGQTFLQVLHDVRIRHASGLLVSTEMSIEQLALEVGYGSYKTFSRIFKTRKGVTPSDYRNAHAGPAAGLGTGT